jgi:hypothetical protein
VESWLASIPRAAFIFAALALVFGVLAMRERMRSAGAPSPKRSAWLRLALIFAAVTVVVIATRP